MSNVKKMIITAVCIALCVIVPMAFHVFPNGGKIFTPMYIPVLLCGLICGTPYGIICGVLGPIFSSVLTGMPLPVAVPPMIVELATYGAVTGLMMRIIRTGKTTADLYISLTTAMMVGRVVSGIAKALIFSKGSYSFAIWVTANFVTALPGVVLQLVLVPVIVVTLIKAKVIPARYE